jgi:hypothetical protein
MTTISFPESSEDWELAFNNALARGEFCNDPTSPSFWSHFELQASETEDGVEVADWFFQKHTMEYRRIPRAEEE